MYIVEFKIECEDNLDIEIGRATQRNDEEKKKLK